MRAPLATCTLLLAAAWLCSAQDTVFLPPASNVESVDFVIDDFHWRIAVSYGLDPAGANTLSVPVMFFPAPGNGLLYANSHPCVIDTNPCCLLDFVEQYVTVGLYDRIQARPPPLCRCR